MSQIPSLGSAAAFRSASAKLDDSLRGLDMDNFLDLMIAELQNQDPLDPLENHELLQQISQIREVGATERLTTTLDAVLLGQNVSSASNLLGKNVRAITDDGSPVEGLVDRVTIVDGIPKLLINDQEVRLTNVAEIRAEN